MQVQQQTSSELASVPIEDIATLLLANQQISLTAPLLSKLSSADVALIVCDEKYMPCGILLPLSQHSRSSEIVNLQIRASAAIKKRCWQSIVIQKILNQSSCLSRLTRQGAESLGQLTNKVGSGDPKNVEAQAARQYWSLLFGTPFRRSADIAVNAALNYGYSIIRSVVARGIVARGLTPALGIHHCSKLNGFNLVDDFIEPFRPVIDQYVATVFQDSERDFDFNVRRDLIALGSSEISIGGVSVPILRATEIMASSYVDAIKENNSNLFKLPSYNL